MDVQCARIAFLIVVAFLIVLIWYSCNGSSNFDSQGPVRVLSQIPMQSQTGGAGPYFGLPPCCPNSATANKGGVNLPFNYKTSPTSTIVDQRIGNGLLPFDVQTDDKYPTVVGPLHEGFVNNDMNNHTPDQTGLVPLYREHVKLLAHPSVGDGASANTAPYMPRDCTSGLWGITDPQQTGSTLQQYITDEYPYADDCDNSPENPPSGPL